MSRLLLLFVVLAAPAFAADKAPEKPNVAALYFDIEVKDPDAQVFNKALAQMMITDLAAADTVRVVDRERLQEVFDELKLQSSKAFDQASAVKVGKLLGAKYTVYGEVIPAGKELMFQAHVRRTETGDIVGGAMLRTRGQLGDIFDAEQKLVEQVLKQIAQAEASEPKAMPPKKATKLPFQSAVKYGQALDALDKKDKVTAKAKLQEVVKEQPDFVLASLDLDKLMK